jgi:hypothetical protein
VAVSGTVAVVGAPGESTFRGIAYAFDATDGSLIATLNNPNPSPSSGDAFGSSVAISGSVAIVGTPGENSERGIAHAFDATDGSLIATLSNPAANSGDFFGQSVAVSGDVAVVGAHQDDPGGITNAGIAYVFDATDGSLIGTLSNPDPATNDSFGVSVAIAGDIALVGAHADDPGGVSDAGTAYVFKPSVAGTCANPGRSEGTLLYNSSNKIMQYCDGANWVGIGKPP